MNEFRYRTSGLVVTEQELRHSLDIILPQVIDEEACDIADVDPVLHSPQPEITKYQTITRNGAVLDGLGNWVQAWTVTDWTQEQKDAWLEDERLRLHTEVAKRRETEQSKGCSYTFPDELVGTIQTRNDRDLTNITGQTLAALVLQAQSVTDPILGFRDEGNVTHQMTPVQMITMGMASSQYVNSTYAAKWVHDEAIEVWDGSTPYDISTGWPE